jgi:hypothetical protein
VEPGTILLFDDDVVDVGTAKFELLTLVLVETSVFRVFIFDELLLEDN